MDFNAIIKRAIGIITKPHEEWKTIKDESATISDLFMKYAIILAAIPAIAGFIGFTVLGRSYMGFAIRMPVGRSLMWAIFTYAFSIISVYILALIIDALAPTFGAQKDMIKSLKIAVYSATATWVAGILYIIPALAFLAMIAGFYSLYLLFTGIKNLKEAPKDKEVGYFIAVIVAQIVLAVIIGMIVATIAFGSARAWM
jgi:hypothetical protein